jgi:hypothetical protein
MEPWAAGHPLADVGIEIERAKPPDSPPART